jgi:hypothetical protein
MRLINTNGIMAQKLSLLLGSLIMLTTVSGCAGVGESATRERAFETPATPAPQNPRFTNLDELESNPTFLSELAPELRAVELSRLWFEHATRLERASYTGTFAALSRSAHIALHSLLSDSCRTPFHAPCRDLDQAYKRAVEALARLLARNSWSPPDLERTRYYLTPASVKALASLREWRVSFDQPSHEQLATRPGLGLASVGCRQIRGVDTVCSPLTFVITFSGTPDSPRSEVVFHALDAFQQEILTLDNSHVPVAAAFEQTALTLGALAGNNSQPTLYCLSMPTSSTSTALILVEATDATATARNILVPLVRDPEITNATTLCLQTVGSGQGAAGLARSIAGSLRAAHSPVRRETLSSSARQPLSIIACGPRATEAAVALANRTSRIRRPQAKKTPQEIRFAPQSLTIICSGEEPLPLAESTDLPTRSYQAPCSHECIQGLKDSLLNTPIVPSSLESNDDKSAPVQDEYTLSPVM